jgi:hypothetical protein
MLARPRETARQSAASTLLNVIPEDGGNRPTKARTAATVGGQAGDYSVLAKSFERSLLAANRSPATIRIYTISVQQLGAFL